MRVPQMQETGLSMRYVTVCVAIFVAVLSIRPIRNMISSRQLMNSSYNPLHLVGTYGAFGSITRNRLEVIVEGTDDPILSAATKWRAYEFKGKPGNPRRAPPQIAPYHLRLDWLMWFAAMSDYSEHPWFVHFLGKLLQADQDTLGLLRGDPFGGRPPRWVRAQLYEYQFASPEELRKTGNWWTRRLSAPYFPPVSLHDGTFRELPEGKGWL